MYRPVQLSLAKILSMSSIFMFSRDTAQWHKNQIWPRGMCYVLIRTRCYPLDHDFCRCQSRNPRLGLKRRPQVVLVDSTGVRDMTPSATLTSFIVSTLVSYGRGHGLRYLNICTGQLFVLIWVGLLDLWQLPPGSPSRFRKVREDPSCQHVNMDSKNHSLFY